MTSSLSSVRLLTLLAAVAMSTALLLAPRAAQAQAQPTAPAAAPGAVHDDEGLKLTDPSELARARRSRRGARFEVAGGVVGTGFASLGLAMGLALRDPGILGGDTPAEQAETRRNGRIMAGVFAPLVVAGVVLVVHGAFRIKRANRAMRMANMATLDLVPAGATFGLRASF